MDVGTLKVVLDELLLRAQRAFAGARHLGNEELMEEAAKVLADVHIARIELPMQFRPHD